MTDHVLKNVKIYEKHAMGYVTVFYNTLQIEILCYHKNWNIKRM